MNPALEPFTNFFSGCVFCFICYCCCCCRHKLLLFLFFSFSKTEEKKATKSFSFVAWAYKFQSAWCMNVFVCFCMHTFRLVYVLVCSVFASAAPSYPFSILLARYLRLRVYFFSPTHFSYTFLFLFARTRLTLSFQCESSWTWHCGVQIHSRGRCWLHRMPEMLSSALCVKGERAKAKIKIKINTQ